MNKGDLVEAVAAELDTTKASASRAVEAIFQCMTTGLKTDASVTIGRFGSFSRRERAARTIRNPSTGEPMEIAPSVTVGFKPAQALKDEMSLVPTTTV